MVDVDTGSHDREVLASEHPSDLGRLETGPEELPARDDTRLEVEQRTHGLGSILRPIAAALRRVASACG